MSFRFTLADFQEGPLRRTGPLLEQQVVARRMPHTPAATDLAFTWRDEQPVSGVNPYWLWITQTDGEMAWTSPIYVDWQGN